MSLKSTLTKFMGQSVTKAIFSIIIGSTLPSIYHDHDRTRRDLGLLWQPDDRYLDAAGILAVDCRRRARALKGPSCFP